MGGKIRWGVIGSGGIARRRTIPEGILPASNAELVAVYSRSATDNEAVAREFDCQAARSVEQLIGLGIDAVYLASPPAAHLAQVRACAQAGVHVLCEKPLGLDVAEAESMVAACRAARVQLGTAFMMRFSAQHRAALALVKEGRLGRLVLGRAQLSCWYPPIAGAWRQQPDTGGGGALIDLGGHCLDLLELFLGPVETVTCLLQRRVHSYPVEDSAVVSLRFREGALGMVDAFFCIPDDASPNRLELYGTHGSLLAEGTLGQEAHGVMRVTLTGPVGGYDPVQARRPIEGLTLDPAPINTYRAEIEAFGEALREGRDFDPSGESGLHSQRVLAACYESATTGRAVVCA
jgi:predicted dehydrogenase